MQLFDLRGRPYANIHTERRVCIQLVIEFPMFYLDHNVSRQTCRLWDVFMRVFGN